MKITLPLFDTQNQCKPIKQKNIGFNDVLLNKKDIISFTNQASFLKTARRAKEAGAEIMLLSKKGEDSIESIENVCKKYIPILEVDYIENIPKRLLSEKLNYNAYTLPHYNEDCALEKITMYIPSSKLTKDVTSSIVHELVHCEQAINNNNYMGLIDITNGNMKQARVLNAMSNAIFNDMQAYKTKSLFLSAYIRLLKCKDEEVAMSAALGCKTDEDLKYFFADKAEKTVDSTIYSVLKEQDVDSFLPLARNPKELKEVIMSQCKLKALQEQEAYSAQKEFLQDIGSSLTVEQKMNPVFYRVLAKALS